MVFWRIWTISAASIGFGYFTRRERNLPHCFHQNVIVEYKLNTAQILHKYMNMSYTVQEGHGWELHELKKWSAMIACTALTALHLIHIGWGWWWRWWRWWWWWWWCMMTTTSPPFPPPNLNRILRGDFNSIGGRDFEKLRCQNTSTGLRKNAKTLDFDVP